MHLFVLILLYCVAMVMAVPGCLSDRDKYHRSRRNCSGADFSEVPAGLEPTTEVLLFPSNTFSSLSWSSFTVFTNLYEIDLTSNKIPEVTPSAIPILPSLRVLRLGRNHLTTLSDGSFSACPALAELYLHDNAIRSLSDNSFSGLSKLEILDLSSNHIQVLPELMLHPLTTIETLYLENNKIRVMPDDWFSKKEEVPYLYLSSNPWACSCSLGYLHRYLGDYELNVYVRDGPIIRGDVESVVCDSPHRLQGQPVINLEESDLCSSQPDYGPRGDNEPVVTTTIPTAPPTTTIPTTLPLSTTPNDATSSPPSCAEGWSTYKNHCFYYVEDKKPWVEAEMNCQKHKGNLASVHSQEELDFVHTLIPDNSTGMSMWVGGSNCQQEDTWLWKDGSVFNFTYWCPTEPNNMFGSQNCLQAALGDMKCWNDLQCDELLPSVCRSNL